MPPQPRFTFAQPAPVTRVDALNTPPQRPAAPVPGDIVEVLGLPARLFAHLLAPASALCERGEPWVGWRWVLFTTSPRVYAAATGAVFTGLELGAMALAAEHDRATPAALEEWIAARTAAPEWRLTEPLALGPVFVDTAPRGISIARVFQSLGLVLRSVCVGDEIPLPPALDAP